MPLTHVCVWDPKTGYRRVSVEEAGKMYPYEVSARGGQFVCELCAQNVGFSRARMDTGTRYFFHSSAAQNKDCEDRQAQLSRTGSKQLTSLNSHTMPLRISVAGSRFYFELGFFAPPDNTARCDKIKIANDAHQVFEYSFDRIENLGTTYLNVGSSPSRVYGIEYQNSNPELCKFWSSKVTGVRKSGSFFDGKTGHILQPGGKAYSGSFYYLLKQSPVYSVSKDIAIKEIAKSRTESFSTWYLYHIEVKSFSATAAKFFLLHELFLTERPTEFYPIWPPYVEDPYLIHHNSSEFYFYLCGEDAELKAYPATANVLDTDDGKLYKVNTRQKEQLISIGKAGSIGFSYLIKQPLNKTASIPKITICDSSGFLLTEGTYSSLPKSRFISISPTFDGKAVVYKKGKLDHIYKLSAAQNTEIDEISFDTKILFYHGCDCVHTLLFERNNSVYKSTLTDQQIVEKLKQCSGPTVAISHSICSLGVLYQEYPLTKLWIRKATRHGEISRKALQILLENTPNHHRRKNNE